MNLSPSEIVSLLGTTTPDLSPRIGTVEKAWESDQYKISGRFFYVRFRDGTPTIDELVEIAYLRMIHFCIPRHRIDEALAEIQRTGAVDSMMALSAEARDLFIKTYEESGRSGELGEILLYMLTEWVLNAPIVACKMYLKTSQQMPVHGADGVHLGYENDKLILYWGESKLHQKLASALTDIAASIAGFTNNGTLYKNEIRLIKENLNISELNEATRLELKKYFNPYAEESNNLVNAYVCLAGFDTTLYEKALTSTYQCSEKEFLRLYQTRINKACAQITQKTVESKLHELRFTYFLLPFPSVDEARQRFQKRLWGRS